MREDEPDCGVPARELREIRAVGDLLIGPLARTVLPDVMEDRELLRRRELANGVKQRIVSTTARE